MHVQLGNVAPLEARPGDEKDKPLKGQRVTSVTVPAGVPLSESLRTVSDLWPRHSSQPPAWVEADDKTFESLLAAEFDCRTGRPRGWKESAE